SKYLNKPWRSSGTGFGIETLTAPLVPIVNAASFVFKAAQPRLARQPSLPPITKGMGSFSLNSFSMPEINFVSACVGDTTRDNLDSSIPAIFIASTHQQFLYISYNPVAEAIPVSTINFPKRR